MAKDFDFKQFMLQKGERVGLGVAVAVMVLLVAAGGYATFKSEDPNKVAKEIDSKRSAVDNNLRFREPSTPSELSEELRQAVLVPVVPPEKYPAETPVFTLNSMEDTKKLNPTVVRPDAFQVDVIRGPLTFHDVIPDGKGYKIGVLYPKEAKAPIVNANAKKTRLELYLDRVKQLNPQLKLPNIQFQYMGMKTRDMIARIVEAESDKTKFELRYVSAAEADALVNEGAKDGQGGKGKLARTIYPIRMVVVSASFPYKSQLEQFRRALRKGSIEDLIKDKDEKSLPQFLGVDVQRRVVKPGVAATEEEWEAVDTVVDKEKQTTLQWAKYRWLISRSVERELEDPEQEKTVIFNKMMVLPRPKLSLEEYPKLNLETIKTTLANWSKHQAKYKGATSVEGSFLNRRLSGEVDVFNEPKESEATGGNNTAAKVDPKTIKETFIPDHCLLRFLDTTVQAGTTYEYRIRLRLDNPNFGKTKEVAYPQLAEVKELEGAWTVVPKKVTIPTEFHYYAESDPPGVARAKDRVFVQMHRWVDFLPLNPDQADTEVPIADWAINDVPVYRGEYIGKKMSNTQVLMWYPTLEAFDFARGTQGLPTRLPKGALFKPPPKFVTVDFTTKPRALLVDFEGGSVPYTVKEGTRVLNKHDESSLEMLILTEDGKLQVRNSAVDMADADRKRRHDALVANKEKLKSNTPINIKTNTPSKDREGALKP